MTVRDDVSSWFLLNISIKSILEMTDSAMLTDKAIIIPVGHFNIFLQVLFVAGARALLLLWWSCIVIAPIVARIVIKNTTTVTEM